METPNVYTRKQLRPGYWPYKAVQEGRGLKTGDIEGPFYVHPTIGGKQVWTKLVAETFGEAKEEAVKIFDAVHAQERGLTVAEAQKLTGRITVRNAVDTYLEQKSNKAPRTLAQYSNTLERFVKSLPPNVQFLDQITPDVLRGHKRLLEEQGYAGKTVDTRLNIIFFLLKKNGIPARIPKDEMPVIEEEPAVPYSDEELQKLFAAMDAEEFIRYKFFLGSACREQEVSFAAWPDIDWSNATYHIRKKLDSGFTPKNHEQRTIPLPKALLALLKERRKNPAHPRWIFVNGDGRPDNHFLRKLKQIAKRAGLNCGHCRTTITVGRWTKVRKEVTCTDQPVCEHFILHRFRKTCATRWMNAGVPIRTIQHYLGHKSLETTMRYLGVVDTPILRSQIDAAYGD
jgi:integrase/recombinase XerD